MEELKNKLLQDCNESGLPLEAIYYLVHNKSLEETAKDLEVSKRTLQLHLKKLEVFNENLHRIVEERKKENQKIGRINHTHKGGDRKSVV